uniref:Hsp33 family molecular chaperone HslO n=1 Tax=Dialister sp. TaxID=1955814 RepID=UPI00402897BA
CSEERIKGTLKSLPEAEKQSLLSDPSIEIVCPYCDKKYTIARDTLSKWFIEGDHVQ